MDKKFIFILNGENEIVTNHRDLKKAETGAEKLLRLLNVEFIDIVLETEQYNFLRPQYIPPIRRKRLS